MITHVSILVLKRIMRAFALNRASSCKHSDHGYQQLSYLLSSRPENSHISLSIQNSVLRLDVCILHPTETQSPSHIQNTKDTPTITSLQLRHPADQMEAPALYRTLLAIRRPHAGRHLAIVTFVRPT